MRAGRDRPVVHDGFHERGGQSRPYGPMNGRTGGIGIVDDLGIGKA